MILHLYDSSAENVYTRLTNSSITLCGTVVGGTCGIVSVKSFLHPVYENPEKGYTVYEVQLTKKGFNKVDKEIKSDIYVYSKWGGFYGADMPEHRFTLCKKCTQHEDFALMILAEV